MSDPAVWAKSCPHVNRTRTPHPHRETAPAQISSHKFPPQLRLQHLPITFLGITVLQSLSRCRPFFPAEKNPYFLQAGKQSYFKAIFKESSSRSSCTRFLTKKVKVRKKETFAFFGSLKKSVFFFHHKVLLRTKLTFFGHNQFLNDEIFFLPKMAKWQNGVEINLDQKKLVNKKRSQVPLYWVNFFSSIV